jgi:hypothetical protein
VEIIQVFFNSWGWWRSRSCRSLKIDNLVVKAEMVEMVLQQVFLLVAGTNSLCWWWRCIKRLVQVVRKVQLPGGIGGGGGGMGWPRPGPSTLLVQQILVEVEVAEVIQSRISF